MVAQGKLLGAVIDQINTYRMLERHIAEAQRRSVEMDATLMRAEAAIYNTESDLVCFSFFVDASHRFTYFSQI